MNQEHLKKNIRSFGKTANTDDDPEVLGVKDDGEYIDAQNARPTTFGSKGALKKIKGETVFFGNTIPPGSYKCIGSSGVNGHVIEMWAEKEEPSGLGGDSLIRIDGQVMLQSPDFPISKNHPLQINFNDNCLGGEIYLTDFNVLPMIFNVQDIIDSYGSPFNTTHAPVSQKYFSQFILEKYVARVDSPMDQPLFYGLSAVGGVGLPPGQYAYSTRYATLAGDRTQFGPETPYIPVPASFGSSSDQYPYSKTSGGNPSDTPNTSFGIHLKIRVNNPFDYEFIEVRRVAANSLAALNFVPQPQIIAKIHVGPGEIASRDFIDRNDSTPIAISDAEDTVTQSALKAAKSVRYYKNRLVYANIKYESRDLSSAGVQFNVSSNGNLGYPCIEKMGKVGHKDPYNHCYKKSLPTGERFGWGMLVLDELGSRSFVVPIENSVGDTKTLRDYKLPNRRDAVSDDTKKVSASPAQGGEWKGVSEASRTDLSAGLSHEIFSLEDAVSKTELSGKNIMADTSDPLGSFNTGAIIGYKPFRPTKNGDGNVSGHNFKVNPAVGDGGADRIYEPKGFAPDYFSTGMTIHGVNTGSLPDYAKSVSIVRTKAAGRVICQGIGMYDISPPIVPGTKGDCVSVYGSPVRKGLRSFWFYSADIDSGMVPSSVVSNLANGQFKVQLVSPLGFFSEVYTFNKGAAFGGLTICPDKGIDMISYARVIRDGGDINPGFVTGYTEYDKFRNTANPSSPLRTGDKGNTEFNITSFFPVSDVPNQSPGSFFKLEIDEDVYETPGIPAEAEANDAKQWTEPWYIINIIADGADIPDNNINDYVDTAHHLKLKSAIGKSNGDEFVCDLVNERWEDCIPNNIGPNGSTENRYVYVVDDLGVEKRWLNVTYRTSFQISSILSSMNSSGFFIDTDGNKSYGVYKNDDVNGDWRYFRIHFERFDGSFNKSLQVPEDGSVVYVRYDERVPIKVFAGTHLIGESVFAPINGSSTNEGSASNQFLLSAPLPYRKFFFSPEYFIPKSSRPADAGQRVQDPTHPCEIGFIRQLLVMFCSETKASVPYAYQTQRPGLLSVDTFFPETEYVMRPQVWDNTEGNNFTDGGGPIFIDYRNDYPQEQSIWGYGGFRTRQAVNTNIDYAKNINDRVFSSKPKVGFKVRTEFCTREIWSAIRAINAQDSPGLKTFPSLNVRDLEDKQGDIVYLYDVMTEKGSNLYAICDHGICLTPTDKRTLSDANAGKVGYMSADSFLAEEIWLIKGLGCPDERWRGIAEGLMTTPKGGVDSALFFPSDDSIIAFINEDIVDLGREGKYFRKVNDAILSVGEGVSTHITGVFNDQNQEYWLQVDGKNVLVYSLEKGGFFGKFTYNFDKYISAGAGKVLGMRGLETFLLDSGDEINGEPVDFFVIQATSPDEDTEKEFVSFESNSDTAPTSVEIYEDVDGSVQCSIENFKRYNGFWNFIPRKNLSVSPSRGRLQKRGIVFKIIHNLAGDFKIVTAVINYKKIK